jgi:hypothetical protein
MFSSYLHLAGETPVDIMLFDPPAGFTPTEWYEGIRKTIGEVMQEKIVAYLNDVDLDTKLKAATTVEEIEQIEIETFPLKLREELSTLLQAREDLNDFQRAFLFIQWLQLYNGNIAGALNRKMQQRAQQLVDRKKSSIILP